MAAVGLNLPGRGLAPGAPNPTSSNPGTKSMVLGRSIQMTKSSAPVTRNTGRRWVSAIHMSHRIGLGRAMRVGLGAMYRSAGPTDELHTTRFLRCGRILIAASYPAARPASCYSACTQNSTLLGRPACRRKMLVASPEPCVGVPECRDRRWWRNPGSTTLRWPDSAAQRGFDGQLPAGAGQETAGVRARADSGEGR